MIRNWIINLNLVLLLLFAQVCFQFALSQSTTPPPDTVSIIAFSPFKTVRECARTCLGCNSDRCGVATALGCQEPYMNSCYCRSDLRASASSWLTDCVHSDCSINSIDAANAVSIYNAYCGLQAGPVTTTQGGDAGTTSTVTIVTTTVISNSGSTSSTVGEKFPELAFATLATLALLLFSVITSWISS